MKLAIVMCIAHIPTLIFILIDGHRHRKELRNPRRENKAH